LGFVEMDVDALCRCGNGVVHNKKVLGWRPHKKGVALNLPLRGTGIPTHE